MSREYARQLEVHQRELEKNNNRDVGVYEFVALAIRCRFAIKCLSNPRVFVTCETDCRR